MNAAVYILSPEIFKYIPQDKPSDFGNDIFPLLLRSEKTIRAYKTADGLENPCKDLLEIIEVQNEDYVGEDDIMRFDDKYGRQILKIQT